MTRGPAGEERLRETLDALAAQVHAPPHAYRMVRAEWRRRERRRRVILASLVAIVFTLANGIGLWALNQTPEGAHVIFDGPAQVQERDPARQVGPP